MSVRTATHLVIIGITLACILILSPQPHEQAQQQRAAEWQKIQEQSSAPLSLRTRIIVAEPETYQGRILGPEIRDNGFQNKPLVEVARPKRVLEILFTGRDDPGEADADSYTVLMKNKKLLFFFDKYSDGSIDEILGEYEDGKAPRYFATHTKSILTKEEAQKLFDEVLRLVEIPLPKQNPKMM